MTTDRAGMTTETLLREWRDARQAIFDNPAEISQAAKDRWDRLGNAEAALMAYARTLEPK